MANWGRILSRGNVEDRRSFAPVAAGGISIAGLALVFLFNYLAGGDITDVLNQVQDIPVQNAETMDTEEFEGKDEYEVFTASVLGSNNDMWKRKFAGMNKTYEEPKLVLFRVATESTCGPASSEVGPHYCPLDQTIYLDETFFDELKSRFGAKGGDVAEAYVISHEVGHHAQNLMGALDETDSQQGAINVELQADCYAGLWANSIKDMGVSDVGEIGEAMDAAAAVGDDRIQKRVNGYVNPESWTHGSSAQRMGAFNKGYESGELSSCENV